MKRYIKSSASLGSTDLLKYGTYEDFMEHNREYDQGLLPNQSVRYGSERAINDFLEMRDHYTYTEDTSGGPWYYLDVAGDSRTKYGSSFVYIDPVRKVWRIKPTANEFYGKRDTDFIDWLDAHDFQY